ncbi:Outer membrane protein beta-barrel domain-containing protein [Reichenbachiella faecimaris]|uniref:Outer membrane protein beta-barrel domain-containing protein n=1 Tax=Reichenbachiella faecimaris TaxID=692418 RepID=A0A1W2GMG6_REIFA|nr:porin family protein [Reichenbachiella faecimaris]SMD37870.1 Outer membrane protein beta-barrel domain-containing protein [Reichenbachiella faecimaris]
MKTKLLALALVGLFAINGAMAQEQGDMRAGLGVVLGTKAGFDEDGEKLGFGLAPSFEYMITDAISGAVSYDWYFKSSVGGVDINISYLNIDGRYYFMTGDTQVYGLAGLGFGMSKVSAGGGSVSDSEAGLNIGAGAVFPMSDALGINAQAKYQTAGDGQLAITAGVVYTF